MLKTWEMFKVASYDPRAKFKQVGELIDRVYYIGSDGILLREPGVVMAVSINSDWELVCEPVDFMTAMKNLRDGSTIRVNWNKNTRTYKNRYTMRDDEDQFLCLNEILDGKWYIED